MEDAQKPVVSRRILWIGVAALSGLALLVASVLWGWPKYRSWSSARALQQAQEAHLTGEFRRQQLFLEQAVQVDPGNQAARRALASFYDQAGLSRGLELWQRLVAEDAYSGENQAGLILCLLRLGRDGEAATALRSLPSELKEQPALLRAAAALALREGKATELSVYLDKLAVASPDGGLELEFSRRALAYTASKGSEREEAFAWLLKEAREGRSRIRATLVLLDTPLAEGDPGAEERAARVAGWVLAAAGKAGSTAPAKSGISELLHYLMTQPEPSARDAAALMAWMRHRGLAIDALYWCSSLRPPAGGSREVVAEAAECAIVAGRPHELRAALEAGAWGPVAPDVLALVFASRIQMTRGARANALATWGDALAAAGEDVSALRVMQRVSEAWGWSRPREECLRRLVRLRPFESPLWGSLLHLVQAEGDVDATLAVLADWCRVQNDPPRVLGERLLLASLLGRLEARERIRLSTLAASAEAPLRVRLAEALVRMGEGLGAVPLSESEVRGEAPRVRLAQALLLQAAGRSEEARGLAETLGEVSFLKEEKDLLNSLLRRSGSP